MANSARAMDDLVSILKSREPLYAKADGIAHHQRQDAGAES